MVLYLVFGASLAVVLLLSATLFYQALTTRLRLVESELRGRTLAVLRLEDAQLAVDEAQEILRLLSAAGLQIENLGLSREDQTRLLNLSHIDRRDSNRAEAQPDGPSPTGGDRENVCQNEPGRRVLH